MYADYKAEITELIEHRLGELLTPVYPEAIYEAMAYSVLGGGKRLRPRLLMAAYHSCGGTGARYALDFACALELIHCYSLIHDDLPAMDDDDFRRGKPSCHKRFGEATAILAGDALLTMAFEVMSAATAEAAERDIRPYAVAMNRIARAAGACGMLGGQVVDIEYSGKEATAEVLTYIHSHKTGELIRAAVEAGAVLGGADEDVIRRLGDAAAALGLAFQIKDDLLDVLSTGEQLGKPAGSDARNRKLTYPLLHGLERSHEAYERLSREAADGISACLGHESYLMRLAAEITDRRM